MTKRPSATRTAKRAAPPVPAGTRAVRPPEDVCIAYPHPVGEVGAMFHVSLTNLIRYDALTNLRIGAHFPMSSGANINTARNEIVWDFLDKTPCQWLWMIDADMVFRPDTLDHMLASTGWIPADEEAFVAEHGKPSGRAPGSLTRPVLGALCFALLKGEAQEIVPTLYGLTQAHQYVRYNGFPENTIVPVVGTGAACLLVHRQVLEAIRDLRWDETRETGFVEAYGVPSGKESGELVFPPPRPWFDETVMSHKRKDIISEDLTFCLRVGQAGFPVHVNTSIEIGHVKPTIIDKEAYYKALPGEEEPAPTYVVVPVKGKYAEFTLPLLNQLREQGGWDQILIYDNAAGTEDAIPEHEFLGWPNVTVIDAAGKSIHQMWNMGIRAALESSARCNIAILNNDLILGDEFLPRLAKGLRAHPSIAAVCPNYDGRVFHEMVQALKGIAAGREDGTGGFAGFAFMARGEIFGSTVPMFDESFELWFGDNDFVLHLDEANATYGMVRDASVVHVGGGSNTSGDGTNRLTPELAEVAERDRIKFEKKWAGKLGHP